MAGVDLGFSEKCEAWRLTSKHFPSKIGGKPAWLDLENVPSGEDASCSKCGDPMSFLCQIYAPYEEDDNNFHRTIFLFVCRKTECHEADSTGAIKVYRSNLQRKNKFYSYDPPNDEPDPTFSLSKWLNLCEVCGCLGNKNCSKCCAAYYCSRVHQVVDWKEKHKRVCGQNITNLNTEIPFVLYPETEIVIEPEDWEKIEVDEEEEKQKYLELLKQGNAGNLTDVNDEELGQYAAEDKDETFTKFRKRVDANPDQILRYDRGGTPLLISNENIPENIPNCEYCGGPRQFEFEIMPQMLWIIGEKNIDWGILMIYTCENSCSDNGAHYKNEFFVRQDVSSIDI